MNMAKYVILVPCNATDLSIKALHKARDIASTMDSIIIVLYVIDDTCFNLEKKKMFVSNGNDHEKQGYYFEKSSKEGAEILIKREVEKLRQNGLSAKCIIRGGNPSDEILDASKKENANLIVMGDSGSLKRLNNIKGIGNISRWISDVANCPVVLIR